MNTLLEKTIGEIVAKDFRTAAVFSKNNMDFCCGGQKTIKEVCVKKNIDENELKSELEKVLSTKADNQINFQQWPVDLLADYIEKTHHRYVLEKAPVLFQYLHKICKVHGENHPELFKVEKLFHDCANALSEHMEKEEYVLFPYIRGMVAAKSGKTSSDRPHFDSINAPIQVMMQEHEAEGDRMRKIREITDNFTPPENACGTYRVAFAMLEEFEQDLHKHIHLENNILFPKSILLEKEAVA